MKLSKLQPATTVHFGKASGNLPPSLETQNKFGARVGIEYGFQSTTQDRSVALGYGKTCSSLGHAHCCSKQHF